MALIVSFRFTQHRDSKQYTAHRVLAGERVTLWYGQWYASNRPYDMDHWVEGKASMRIKVGKKRKLVTGRLQFNSEGRDEYSWTFVPNRARDTKIKNVSEYQAASMAV